MLTVVLEIEVKKYLWRSRVQVLQYVGGGLKSDF